MLRAGFIADVAARIHVTRERTADRVGRAHGLRFSAPL